jgi:hypothetical protein
MLNQLCNIFSQFKDFQTFLSRNPSGRPPCRWTAAGANSGSHRQCWVASTPGVAKLHLHELRSFTVPSRILSRNLSMLEQPIGIRAGKQKKIKMIKISISSEGSRVQLFKTTSKGSGFNPVHSPFRRLFFCAQFIQVKAWKLWKFPTRLTLLQEL